MQKDVTKVQEDVRGLNVSISGLMNEIQSKVSNFDLFYKEQVNTMKKQITDDRDDLRIRQEKYQLELKPKLEHLASMETRVERVVEFCSQI
jgi:peptidoglycan hydrolase CwlO-like protein